MRISDWSSDVCSSDLSLLPRALLPRALLPLDRPRRLGGHVVDDAVDAAHLVDEAGRDAGQEIVVEGVALSGHAVGRGDGPEGADVVRSEEHTSELPSIMRIP